jgi:hypothetical protein
MWFVCHVGEQAVEMRSIFLCRFLAFGIESAADNAGWKPESKKFNGYEKRCPLGECLQDIR